MKHFYFLIIFLFITGCSIDLSKSEEQTASCTTTTYGNIGSCATIGDLSMVGVWYVYDGNRTIMISDGNISYYSYEEGSIIYQMTLLNNGDCGYIACSTNGGCSKTKESYQWGVLDSNLTIVDTNNLETHYTFLEKNTSTNKLIFSREDNATFFFYKQ